MMPLACLQLCPVLLLMLGQVPVPTAAAVVSQSAVRDKALGRFVPESHESGAHGQEKQPLHLQRRAASNTSDSDLLDIGGCILLFGALHRGNMGDMAQSTAVEHLLASVAPPGQCFWYARPWDEGRVVREKYAAKISSGDLSRLIPFDEVNRFKALVVAGGGIFNTKQNHAPADVDALLGSLTLPVVVMSVSTSPTGKHRRCDLLHKAVFVSGRDESSTKALSGLLRRGEALVRPSDVALVRDPVLSDDMLTDTEGKCWKQSEGEHEQPLCFVLPASRTKSGIEMHRHLVDRVVKRGDVFIAVFPERRREQREYPGEVRRILDWTDFTERLCSCRAIVSTRVHGVILGLHMGVPTFGAFPSDLQGNEVHELMVDTMRLPEQALAIDEKFTRDTLDLQVKNVRREYADRDRRASIHAQLSVLSGDFRSHARHVLFDVVGLQEQPNQDQTQKVSAIAPGNAEEKVSTKTAKGSVTAAGDADKKSPILGVVPGKSQKTDEAVKHSVPSLAATLLHHKAALKRPWDVATKPTRREDEEASEREALASHHHGSVDETPPAAAAAAVTKEEISETMQKRNGEPVGHGLAPETELSFPTSKATSAQGLVSGDGNNVDMLMARGSPIVEAFVGTFRNDFIAAILLILATIGLALLPQVPGAPRRPADSKFVATEGSVLAETTVLMEISSSTSSDSERSVVSEWQAPRQARATNGAAAPSSTMFFILNFTMWASLAAGFSSYGKTYLDETSDPVGLLVLQGVTGVSVLCFLGRFGGLGLHPGKDLTPAATRQAGLTAVFHTSHALLTNFAVLMGGVAVTDALKAVEPAAAAAFSYFLLGKTCSSPRVVALTTIMAGTLVMMLERNDNNNNNNNSSGGVGNSGFVLAPAVLAVAAVCFNALRNVVIKKSNPIPPHHTLLACSVAATVFGIGLMLLKSGFLVVCNLVAEEGSPARSGRGVDARWLRMSGVNAALCFVGYNLASFNLLVRLAPVGHAVGNSCKRMLVFVSGLFFMGETMTVRQLGGTAVALFGVLAYNIAGT